MMASLGEATHDSGLIKRVPALLAMLPDGAGIRPLAAQAKKTRAEGAGKGGCNDFLRPRVVVVL
ncbi:hypothetical protein [Pseudoduganella lurida]|uniref:hypothetical protein n=1 Tax=Pseudoduganella lurida TaxID=1036180 RepID=UPI0011A681D0|nr:hypothetical protein [Pseudoduganella lurida]